MTTLPDLTSEAWHLDKRIPIALIATIVMQTGAAAYWIGQLSHRLDGAVALNEQQDQRIAAIENASNTQAIVSATMNAQLTAVRESIAEIKAVQSETNRLLQEFLRQGARP